MIVLKIILCLFLMSIALVVCLRTIWDILSFFKIADSEKKGFIPLYLLLYVLDISFDKGENPDTVDKFPILKILMSVVLVIIIAIVFKI